MERAYRLENEIFITRVRWLLILGSPVLLWFYRHDLSPVFLLVTAGFAIYNLVLQRYLSMEISPDKFSKILSVIDSVYVNYVYFYTLQGPTGLPQLYYFLILVMGIRHGTLKYNWMVIITGLFFALVTVFGEYYFGVPVDILDILNQLVFFTAFGIVSSFIFYRNYRQQLEKEELITELQAAYQQLCIYNAQVEELANTDPLTGLYNYRFFVERMEKELELSKRFNHSTSLILIDLDHFKEFNDRYGHPSGDKALKEAARIFRESIRDKDILCRYGGEEFLILLPSTGIDEAYKCAERIRQAMEDHRIIVEGTEEPVGVTISGGVATYPVDAESGAQLLQIADEVLYVAKDKGRNMIYRRNA